MFLGKKTVNKGCSDPDPMMVDRNTHVCIVLPGVVSHSSIRRYVFSLDLMQIW
jgi:hypothetical protein